MEGTTIAVTLATEGWVRGALQLTEKYAGNTAMYRNVVSECLLKMQMF